MIVSPLTVGVLTGAADADDPAIARAIEQMVHESSKADLERTVCDLASLVQALSNVLSQECGATTQEILTSAIQ